MTGAAAFKARMFARDLAACIALSDERKRENAERRKRCQANAELCAHLVERARRRGESAVNWPEYFRNIGIAE